MGTVKSFHEKLKLRAYLLDKFSEIILYVNFILLGTPTKRT
jgi:hypothetical protein